MSAPAYQRAVFPMQKKRNMSRHEEKNVSLASIPPSSSQAAVVDVSRCSARQTQRGRHYVRAIVSDGSCLSWFNLRLSAQPHLALGKRPGVVLQQRFETHVAFSGQETDNSTWSRIYQLIHSFNGLNLLKIKDTSNR